jgi:hypothetical protein
MLAIKATMARVARAERTTTGEVIVLGNTSNLPVE